MKPSESLVGTVRWRLYTKCGRTRKMKIINTPYMLLELTVYYLPDDYDPDNEVVKTKPKMNKGTMVVNTDHIVAFNPHDSGETMVRFSNGDVVQTTIKFKSFRKIMEEIEVAKDILVSGDN